MIVLKFAFYLSVALLSFCFLIIYTNSHPAKYPFSRPPSEFGLIYEDVAFETGDGLIIRGWFVPASGEKGTAMPLLIICHGLGANMSDFTDFASYLAADGFSVLLFDFRAHGDSDGRRSSFGYREKEDLRAAIGYVVSREDVDSERVGVYGFSMGAAVAIMTAAEDSRIKSVVADSSYTTLSSQGMSLLKGAYGELAQPLIHPISWIYSLYFRADPDEVSPIGHISEIAPRPVLIIGGGEDEQIPASDAVRLFAAAGEPKDLWLVPGAVHGGTLYSAGVDYYRRIGEFFAHTFPERMSQY